MKKRPLSKFFNLPMKTILFLLGFILFVPLNFGQNNTDNLLTNFFQHYEKSSSDAIDYAFSGNKWMEDRFEEILSLKHQLFETTELLGKYEGYEKISEKQLGESLKEVICIVKYNRQPMRFQFNFYKAKEDWVILNFHYSIEFSKEFDELN